MIVSTPMNSQDPGSVPERTRIETAGAVSAAASFLTKRALSFDPERTSSLLRAAQQGDKPALEGLFSRYLARVTQMVALRLGVPPADVHVQQDLVQEALLSAFRSLDSFEHRSEGSFRNWLAGIVENRIRDYVRRRDAQKRSAGQVVASPPTDASGRQSPPPASPEPSPSEHAMGHELEARIERALLDLGERYRRAFELRRLAEMSYEEIAEEMGLSGAASARALFARTLSKIADAVGDVDAD